ncbi:hypothetical protein N7490_002404 [Penicillium lividum]|nr:hypothetical protein N7490_002404 [Penicillium lividum]
MGAGNSRGATGLLGWRQSRFDFEFLLSVHLARTAGTVSMHDSKSKSAGAARLFTSPAAASKECRLGYLTYSLYSQD